MIFDEWWSQYAPGIQPIVSQNSLAKAAWEAAQKEITKHYCQQCKQLIVKKPNA